LFFILSLKTGIGLIEYTFFMLLLKSYRNQGKPYKSVSINDKDAIAPKKEGGYIIMKRF